VKLITFAVQTSLGSFERVGAFDGSRIVDLVAAYGASLADGHADPRAALAAEAIVGKSMLELLEGGRRSMDAARQAHAFAGSAGADVHGPRGEATSYSEFEVGLCAPLPRPRSLRDFSGYRSHMETYFRQVGLPDVSTDIFRSRPMYYKANAAMVHGPGDTVPWPSMTSSLDFEIELAVVIGAPGRDVPLQEADAHIAGYLVMNDFTLRDVQKDELSLPMNLYGLSKAKDVGGYALGPCLVTPDEFAFEDATFIVRLNGEEVVREGTEEMTWSFAELVEYSSRGEPIEPGDVLAGGAPPRGCGADIGRTLEPGDVIECEVSGIGVLRNVVGARDPGDAKGVISGRADASAAVHASM
jgi:2-keto-4-pentenoate hydratase/2-oxohepta-3-ene-1,7-dioic acid hydratase in catechol pathway